MGIFKNRRAPKYQGQKFIDDANKRNSKNSGVSNMRAPKPKQPNRRRV